MYIFRSVYWEINQHLLKESYFSSSSTSPTPPPCVCVCVLLDVDIVIFLNFSAPISDLEIDDSSTLVGPEAPCFLPNSSALLALGLQTNVPMLGILIGDLNVGSQVRMGHTFS